MSTLYSAKEKEEEEEKEFLKKMTSYAIYKMVKHGYNYDDYDSDFEDDDEEKFLKASKYLEARASAMPEFKQSCIAIIPPFYLSSSPDPQHHENEDEEKDDETTDES